MALRRTVHVPVMLHEVLEHLELPADVPPHPFTIVDGTVGAGGHSAHIARQMPAGCTLIGLDRDDAMLTRAAQVVIGPDVQLRQASYATLGSILDELGIDQVDRVLLDLGLSSDQLADADRGFGFETTGELDMRFDRRSGQTAAQLLNSISADELATLLETWSEDRDSHEIARAIVKQRSHTPLQTADDLMAVISQVIRGNRKQQMQTAARVFQALRIAVNEELKQLEDFLSDGLPRRLRKGGRAVIITFHSLEDRLVKQAFREVTLWDNLTRKPIAATPSEIRLNPRARSAKLRVAARK